MKDETGRILYSVGKSYRRTLNEVWGDVKYSSELKTAAENGDAVAQLALGRCYLFAEGVDKDSVEAMRWLRKAAEQGLLEAQSLLGGVYLGLTEDKVEGVKWIGKAAEQGNASGQFLLGVCYFTGDPMEEDKVEAVKWFRKAAEQGNAEAQYMLGYCNDVGEGVESVLESRKGNKVEAQRWYRAAAEQGHAGALYALGRIREAAERGHDKAQLELGSDCFYKVLVAVVSGEETKEEDRSEAIKWLRKAAEQENTEAQRLLGLGYMRGCFGMVDNVEAVKWYRKAAEGGDVNAQMSLGDCYRDGVGVDKNVVEAAEWYRKAAEGALKKLEELVK